MPPDGAREVDAQALNRDGLVVWFSEPIDTSRLEVRLQTGSGSLLLWPAEVRAETLRVLPESHFDPGRILIEPGTLYRLLLLGIRDWAGNTAGDLAVEFTTGGAAVDSSAAPGTGAIITTMAGTGTAGFGGDGGPATLARLNRPTRICVDDRGCLYIADTGNHRIRKVDTGGIITTVAGTGQSGFGGDGGPAVLAQLQAPLDVAMTGDGSLYIADTGNYRMRRVGPDGMISTVAGVGTESLSHSWRYAGIPADDGEPATDVEVVRPSGVVSDGNG
ncbi:MAG: hypothetical protein WDA75_22990, partial [Candidatus Latescibacterota bacterium]